MDAWPKPSRKGAPARAQIAEPVDVVAPRVPALVMATVVLRSAHVTRGERLAGSGERALTIVRRVVVVASTVTRQRNPHAERAQKNATGVDRERACFEPIYKVGNPVTIGGNPVTIGGEQPANPLHRQQDSDKPGDHTKRISHNFSCADSKQLIFKHFARVPPIVAAIQASCILIFCVHTPSTTRTTHGA